MYAIYILFKESINFRIWLDWWWDSLFLKVYRFLKMDRIEFLQRTTFVEHLLTNKKMYDFENDLSIIDINRGFSNHGYNHSNGDIIAGNGWTKHPTAATRTPTPMPYMSQ